MDRQSSVIDLLTCVWLVCGMHVPDNVVDGFQPLSRVTANKLALN